MKFGKELSSQMVQEWQTAYMDYNSLKKLLKDLLKFRRQKALTLSTGPGDRSRSLKRRLTMYRAFSGLSARNSPRAKDDEVILVGSVPQEGSESHYQTMFLRSSEEGGEYELVFFRRLDDEFNKVVKFYKEKVREVKAKAEDMSKQMDALIALRITVEKPRMEQRGGALSPATVFASVDGVEQERAQMETIQEVEMSSEGSSRGEHLIHAERNENDTNSFRPAPLHVLDHVQINFEPDTPVSTLRKVIGSPKTDLSFSKEELRKAEEKLRQAFIEFYQQLRLLKSYCFLNMLAFSKIMKKYDKITSRSASKSYLEMVDNSYLGTSDEVNKLIERLEAIFIKHFANGNRQKGMKSLKPGHKREKHRTTFFLGLFTGCSIALVIAIIVSLHGRNLLDHRDRGKYMNSIFPLYSLFGFIVLHMLMYGTNTFLWRRYRVNYPFIIGFKPGTELGFREVFLLASGLSVLSFAAVISNLNMEMDPNTRSYEALTELVPLALVIFVLFIVICPFNIIYRSSRFFLLRCAWHCLCAPLYKVILSDFFLADQLTSQIQSFRSLLFYVFYYFWGDFTTRSNDFVKENKVYEILLIVVAIIPFWSRSLQCLRRLFEEKDHMQGLNFLKYFSTIVALTMRTMYSLKRGMFWKVMAASTSGFTTICNTYWDIVIDWGLLQRNSRNAWLRDKLLISNKAVYFGAIVANILLRLVWMQLVLDFNETSFLHEKAMVAIVASLEIFRRGIWNFFRLENEHFNNVGKYRAFKSVPLPFHYHDDKIM